MLPWPILWALRKVALVPTLVLTGAALGGAYGTFDLAKRATGLVLPPPKQRRTGTGTLASLAALSAGGALIGVRETLFAPPAPPPLALAASDKTLRRFLASAFHAATHFPYAHRFNSYFGAGLIAAVAYRVAERALNAPPPAGAPAGAPAAAAVAVARVSADRDDGSARRPAAVDDGGVRGMVGFDVADSSPPAEQQHEQCAAAAFDHAVAAHDDDHDDASSLLRAAAAAAPVAAPPVAAAAAAVALPTGASSAAKEPAYSPAVVDPLAAFSGAIARMRARAAQVPGGGRAAAVAVSRPLSDGSSGGAHAADSHDDPYAAHTRRV